jgi:hypothetical protein
MVTTRRILLVMARVTRERAELARNLADQMREPAAIEGLQKFATELEQRAADLEFQASEDA